MSTLLNNLCNIIIVFVITFIGYFLRYFPNRDVLKGLNKLDAHLDRIVDNIFLGNWSDSIDRWKLEYNNIKCILTLNHENIHNEKDIELFNQLGIHYKYIKIHDSIYADILPYVEPSIGYIKQCDGNVLVHCSAGISRSVSIVVAYLIKEKGMTYDQAIQYVRERRPIANPNNSFTKQLKSL